MEILFEKVDDDVDREELSDHLIDFIHQFERPLPDVSYGGEATS